MSSEVADAQQEVVEEFQFFDNWMDRYQYLIDLGRRLPEFPEADRVDANKIRGCQSQVWFVAHKTDGRLEFRAISDAAIVSGLIAVLLRIYSGKTPQDILDTPADFVTALQLEAHLSPTLRPRPCRRPDGQCAQSGTVVAADRSRKAVSPRDFSLAGNELPLPANMLRVRDRGIEKTWRFQGLVAGRKAHRPMSPMGRERLRSCAGR
jgi:cysteine desulfuration protein SufE